jgi:hypothetical protein
MGTALPGIWDALISKLFALPSRLFIKLSSSGKAGKVAFQANTARSAVFYQSYADRKLVKNGA